MCATNPPTGRPRAWRTARRAASFALAALILCAAPALAQPPPRQQIDPLVPTNIPEADQYDFKGYLDQVMEEIQRSNGPTVLAAGNTLWRGLAAIVVVWTGIKIAMSGTFSMWAIIELIIGLWIPWVMLLFYATNIPGMTFTFPGMIAAGGNWLHSFFLSDIVPAVKIELANLVTTQTTALSDAWAGTSWFELTTAFGDAMSTLLIGTVMSGFIFLCLVIIYAVTYAQVILGADGDHDPGVRRADDDPPPAIWTVLDEVFNGNSRWAILPREIQQSDACLLSHPLNFRSGRPFFLCENQRMKRPTACTYLPGCTTCSVLYVRG